MMYKKFWVGSTLSLIAVLGALVFLVSGQTSPGSEVTALFLLNAQPLGTTNTTTNTCMAGASAPCIDTDGGYAPAVFSSVAASVVPMSSAVSPFGGNIVWSAQSNIFQCVQASELCDVVTGELLEVVCGSSIGIPNNVAFNAAFPGNLYGELGEPVALMRVNCATYAQNNPGSGLLGQCSLGACI